MKLNKIVFSIILATLLFSVFVAAERGEQLWPNGLDQVVNDPAVFSYPDVDSGENGLGAIWQDATLNAIAWTVGNVETGQWPGYGSNTIAGTAGCTGPIARSNSTDELMAAWFNSGTSFVEASFFDDGTDTWGAPQVVAFAGGEVYDIAYDSIHGAWTVVTSVNGGNQIYVDTYTAGTGWTAQTLVLGGGITVGALDAEFDPINGGPDGTFIITIHDDNGANLGQYVSATTWEAGIPGTYANGDGTGWTAAAPITGTAGKTTSQAFDINEQTGNGGYVFEVAGTTYITDWGAAGFAGAATTVENVVPQNGTLAVGYYSTTDGNDDGAVFWQENGTTNLTINALDNSGNPAGVGSSVLIRNATVANGAVGYRAANYSRLDIKAVIVPIVHLTNTEGIFGIPYHTDATFSTQTPSWNVVGNGMIEVVWTSDMPTNTASVEWDNVPPAPFGNVDVEAALNLSSRSHSVNIAAATGADYVYELKQTPWGSDQEFTDDNGAVYYDFDTYPELSVTDIRAVPNPVSQGNNVNVEADIWNAGAADILVDFDNDYTDDAGGSEPCVMGAGHGAGVQDTCTYIVDTTGYSIGDHVMTVETDGPDVVSESDEGNNITVSDDITIDHLEVQAAGLQADLEVTDFTFVPDPVTEGNTTTATIEVTNNGTGTTGAGFNNSYDDDEGASDACAIATLGAGLTDDCDVIVDTTGYMLGTHVASAEADSTDVISESDEANNGPFSAEFEVESQPPGGGGPDLIVNNVAFSAEPVAAGTDIDITVTIENQDDTTTGVGFDTELQDPNGIVLPDCSLPALAATSTDDCDWLDYDTSALPAGANKFIITADVGGDIAETSETNNIYWAYLTITSGGGGPGGTGFGAAPGLEMVGYAIVAISGLAVFLTMRKH